MFAQVLAEDFTLPIRTAWIEFYKFMANAMTETQLKGKALTEMGDSIAQSQDPVEISRLKSARIRGFYGTEQTATGEEV